MSSCGSRMNSLFSRTPILEAHESNKLLVYLKLENTQPTGSFKARGISQLCVELAKGGCNHFVSSSGGNAGLAVAYCGRQLKLPVTVFVPHTTSESVRCKLLEYGAEVKVKGKVWDETNEYALKFVNKNVEKQAALVHPFNHKEIWKGHASLVHELKEQLKERPSALVVSVGGGGLLCGVVQGLHDVGWAEVPVIACETYGADCFSASLKAGKLVKLDEITSIAKSLGALEVVPEALEWTKKHKIISVCVTDKEAVAACLRFADDYKMLVEPACGAALSVMYSNKLSSLMHDEDLFELKSIVIVVCGGSAINLQTLIELKETFNI